MTTELRKTSLYDRQKALGARFVPFTGWELPVQYSGVTDEHQTVREAAGLFDVSHMGELWVAGPGAGAAINRLVTNDVAGLEENRALYTVACNADGTILDDLIVYRVQQSEYLIVCNASNRDKMAKHFSNALVGDATCEFDDRSDQTALLALQGPRAATILEALQPEQSPGELARFGTLRTVLGTPQTPLLIARTGYTGEDGFEMFCAWDDAPGLWDAILEAGAPHGIKPIGLGARDTLRLEASLALYGNDIDEQTNPYEASLGWVVKPNAGPFLGDTALAEVKANKPERKLVGFEMVGRGIPRHGYPIVDSEGRVVGEVTSGAPGLTVGKKIGMGYVPRASSRAGTEIGIEIRGKVIEAKITKMPFYRRPA